MFLSLFQSHQKFLFLNRPHFFHLNCFLMASKTTTTASGKRDANHLSAPTADSKKFKSNTSITSFFGVPKPKNTVDSKRTVSSSSSSSLSSSFSTSNFNKEKWVASLSPEQKDLLQLEIQTLDDSWLAQLKDEVTSPEFLSLKRFLKQEKQSGATIFPPENEIYSWYIHPYINTTRLEISLLMSLPGHDILPYTRSRLLSLAKIHITIITRPTVLPFPSALLHQPLHPSQISTKASKTTTHPSSHL